MTARRFAAVGLGALLVSVPGFGCGSSSKSGSNGGGGSPTAVKLVDFAFAPKAITVKAGQTVTWTNTGHTLHNVTGPGFVSKALNTGETYSHKFTKSGRFSYMCTLHPQLMRAVVVVQ